MTERVNHAEYLHVLRLLKLSLPEFRSCLSTRRSATISDAGDFTMVTIPMRHAITRFTMWFCPCAVMLIVLIGTWSRPTGVVAAGDERIPARSIEAVRVDVPPAIDGDLSDTCWQKAAFQGDFRRISEPDRGTPARVATSFAIAYDKDNLYIAVDMRNEDPKKLFRSITRRDENLDEDDNICLYLDTFLDLRSAYFFQINPIGAQRDIFSTSNGSSADIAWDGVWDAEAFLLEDGWSAEFRIPFKILRLNWSEDMTFGFDMVRTSIQREDASEWCFVDLNRQSTLDPRQYGIITGLKGIDKPLMLQVIGSAVGSIVRTNNDVFPPPEETGWDSEEEFDTGLDIIWGLTPTLTFNGTLNPDFAQVEADPDQLNLNGEELMLQERRPFFRENSAIFIVPDGEYPFYSRRINDIDQGLRLTGQIAGSDTALLLVNGEDGSGEENLFGVLRTQSPFSEDLTISSWFIAKHNRNSLENFTNSHNEYCGDVDNDANYLAGLDGSHRPGNWIFNLHAYSTWYPDATRAWWTDQPTREREIIRAKIRYNGDEWMTFTDYTDIGTGYNPELGFVNVSLIGNRTLMQYFWAGKSYDENHFLNDIEMTSHVLTAWSRDDGDWCVLGCNGAGEITFDNYLEISMSGEWYDDRSFYKFNDFSRDESGEIINSMARYYAETLGEGNNKVRTLNADISWSDGGFQGVGLKFFTGFYYFSRVRQWNVWANWSWRQTVTAEVSLDQLERCDPSEAWIEANGDWKDWNIWIYRAKFMVSFNRDLHLRTILSGYADESRRFNKNGVSMLLSWQFLPGSNLHCVYESNWVPYDYKNDVLLGINEWIHGEQVFYVKVSYMLNV